MTTTSIPPAVKNIGVEAFRETAITSIFIPASVVSIGSNIFMEAKLQSYEVAPDNPSYYSIDGVLFTKDNVLLSYPAAKAGAPEGIQSEFVIPRDVTEINSNILENLKNITAFSVEEGNPVYSSADGVLYNADKTRLVRFPGGRVGVFRVPASVKNISEYAFASAKLDSVFFTENSEATVGFNAFLSCSNLKYVYLPNTVVLSAGSFGDCTSLTSFRIPGSMTSVPNDLLARCYALTTVEIPENITRIGTGAFIDCVALREIRCKAQVPPIFHNNLGYVNLDQCRVIVPVGSKEAYTEADVWKSFKNIVDESIFINWSIDEMSVRQGKRFTLAVSMKNPTPVISFQCDIHLPKGFTILKDEEDYLDVSLSPRGLDRKW